MGADTMQKLGGKCSKIEENWITSVFKKSWKCDASSKQVTAYLSVIMHSSTEQTLTACLFLLINWTSAGLCDAIYRFYQKNYAKVACNCKNCAIFEG